MKQISQTTVVRQLKPSKIWSVNTYVDRVSVNLSKQRFGRCQ